MKHYFYDMTLTAREICGELNISRNTLNYWIHNCVPKEYKFRKAYTEDFPNGRYLFSNDDYRILRICKDLKKTLSAMEVRKALEEYFR